MNTDKTYAEAIASQYAVKETSKLTALKKLDRAAKRPANIFSWSFGIVSILLLGTGMCYAMGTIGNGSFDAMVFGTVLGVIGIIGAGINYPIYNKLLAAGKKKYAFEIMELAKEISDNAEYAQG